mmetsp:Transcript_2977/g.9094  ORF Transcript_2977/g.9094 Transcript_2977/m.9094 type:complete len:127 (+) Transcript_2977:67-447(+)
MALAGWARGLGGAAARALVGGAAPVGAALPSRAPAALTTVAPAAAGAGPVALLPAWVRQAAATVCSQGRKRFRVTSSGNIKYLKSGCKHRMRKHSRSRNRDHKNPETLGTEHPRYPSVKRMLNHRR